MRPTHEMYLHGSRGDRTVVVPHQFVTWLGRSGGLIDLQRRNRGDSDLINAVLAAFGLAALETRASDPGSDSAPRSEVETRSVQLLSTRRAADQLHMTTRAVTDACKSGRLPGTQDTDGRWWIHPDDLADYPKAA